MQERAFDEYDFLSRLRGFGLGDDGCEVPIGDDAAVLAFPDPSLVLALDTVIDGVHAEGDDAPEILARKVLRSNISDIAAMGAEPVAFLLSLTLPRDAGAELAGRVMRALAADAGQRGVAVVGGDTVVAPGPLALAGTLVGRCPGAPFRRDAARPGHRVLVTGACGGSILGRHGDFEPRLPESRLLRVGPGPGAVTDVSDGLARDAANLAEASGVRIVLDAASIPVHPDARRRAEGTARSPLDHALNDGEDFELLFTWPEESLEILRANWKSGVPFAVIGRVERGDGLGLDRAGEVRDLAPGGYRHRSERDS